MADGEANDGCAANDIVELEAMRKDGLSWHPCQVSLCSRGLGLIVLYENDSQERITDKQEIFARIRVRSTPLQGDDCSSIRQGEHVLATKSSQVDGVFYDARMEKVIHVRHSKRIHCRCSFTIKWLHRSFPDEALTVPASAIMKLATKNINLHPTIAAFISSQEPSNALDAAPCLEIAEGNNWEMDINVLLEQQIKKISTSHVPQENFLKDCVSEHKADLGGQSHGWEIKASSIISLGSISVLDKLNSFNGSENTQPVESILDKSPVSTPSIQEELRGTRFLINPLAARAALASLRSESPQTPEFSARTSEKVDMTGHHSVASLHQGSKLSSFSAVDCSSNGEKKSLNISAALEGKSPNLRSISKKLFPTSSPPHVIEISNLSPGSQMNGTEEKKTRLSGVKRLTRSQIQRDNGVHGIQQLSNNNEMELTLTETRRVTRSRVKGSEKIEAEKYNAGKDHVHNEFTQLETFLPRTATPTENLKTVASPINVQTNTQRVTRSRVKGVETTEVTGYNAAAVDGMAVDADTEKGHMIEDAGKHNIPKRLTRSAASKNAESDTAQLQLKRRKNNSIESASEINENFAEEGESRKIPPTRAETTPKSSESNGGSDRGTRQRSASSKKQETTRFSPRLRLVSQQTQSQNKV